MSDQNERQRLLAEERQLASAISEFEHQLRRIRDRLERSGGHAPLIETELRQVQENLDLARRDINRVRNRLDKKTRAPG